MSAPTTVIEDIETHLTEFEGKLREMLEVHLPAVSSFVSTLRSNPLVTAFASSIPGPLSGDAMAILNGLVPLLGALGGHVVQGAAPAGPALSPVSPATDSGAPATPAVSPPGFVTGPVSGPSDA